MSVNYHTPLNADSRLNGTALEYPLGELDYAIFRLANWELDFVNQVTVPTLPAGGYAKVYFRGGQLTILDDAGVEHVIYTSDQYALVQDIKSAADGGTFTQGDWRTRSLTDVVFDPYSIVALSSNQITLRPGTYRLSGMAVAAGVLTGFLRWRNITDGVTVLSGALRVSGVVDNIPSWVQGSFAIAVETVFELQQYCQTTVAGYGFGEGSWLTSPIYAQVELWKL